MDSREEDKYGMFLKMESFLTARAALLSVNPIYADILSDLTATDLAITQADSTANRNLTGFTIDKQEKRIALNNSVLTVAAAARGYYTTNYDSTKQKLATFARSTVERTTDAEIITLADSVHDVAEPVKALLNPWGVASGDVDNLLLLVNAYRPTVVAQSRQTDVSVRANERMDKLFAANDTLLNEQFDQQFAVYEFTNNGLYLEGQLARAIDDSGGNSGTEGFDVQTITVPGNGTVTFPVGGTPSPDDEVYIRAINGSVYLCGSPTPVAACTPGAGTFLAQRGVTFKGLVSGLGIDLSQPYVNITNPSPDAVIVRVGTKI